MKVQITKSARDDIARGISFYEQQYAGVGKKFRASVLADIKSLALNGGMHFMHFGYHCKICERFPFAIFYECMNSWVLVVAVLDMRGDPEALSHRLGSD